MGNRLLSFVQGTASRIASSVNSFVSSTYSTVSNNINNAVNNAVGAGKALVSPAIAEAQKTFTNIKNTVDTIGSKINNGLSNLGSSISQSIESVGNAYDFVAKGAENAIKSVSRAGQTIVSGTISAGQTIVSGAVSAGQVIGSTIQAAANAGTTTTASEELTFLDFIKKLLSGDLAGSIVTLGTLLADFVESVLPGSIFSNTVRGVIDTVNGALVYQDGVTESRYGQAMERSWAGGGANSFLSSLNARSVSLIGYTVNFSVSTPLDPQNEAASLYGNMMLGTPMVFTEITDPRNRVVLNTFVKDSNFLSLTPGMPKYNGGAFAQASKTLTGQAAGAAANALGNVQSLNTNTRSNVSNVANAAGNAAVGAARGVSNFVASTINGTGDYLNQTNNPDAAMAYLLKNGIDTGFTQNDKRYYTFEPKYAEYFSYLETMLNTIWIKLGLGTEDNTNDPEKKKFNIFTFFDIENDKNYKTLQNKYQSSIGFFVNIASKVTENISSSTTSIGAELEEPANKAASTYQKLNYLTGMGTDKLKKQTRAAAVIANSLKTFKTDIAANIDVKSIGGFLGSINYFTNENDISALVQAFGTNGMRVKYPELWSSTEYGKNIQFDFNFISPYGDPLSIFQYVYVPFLSLLAFIMPRQAAENGLVSPFFVRADVPGLITSDLAMISEISWTKGGENNLWTKDKLPRAINGSFTITDLFPYLAMVKRISFLSSNPSYTVFLDNMAGLRTLYTTNTTGDALNKYWKRMLNRISGEQVNPEELLWNSFGNDRKNSNKQYGRTSRDSISKNINKNAMNWLSKV
jgi:hypothetical protein